jgi:hypothetical protein
MPAGGALTMAELGWGAAADSFLMGSRLVDDESLRSLTTIQTQEGVTSIVCGHTPIAMAVGAIFEMTRFLTVPVNNNVLTPNADRTQLPAPAAQRLLPN